ncbi:NUDIX domain-containing protein [Lampropedia aestuarii]|uniref:NUDIX domain-containing protein n=1 Tax=Lampropedia aestuarii TaxID=2562762 RepID=A0A4S5BQP9_9BURK|nr:NUDIX hydrolase [Lampropedia aestuarii]THJ33503.1 NUDIX domain-containing protein [Lampropedia aestuarii]
MTEMHPFHGAKIALFLDRQLLVYQRDNKASIPFPGLWDLPGGGREGNETPMECVLREVREEFGIALQAHCVRYTRAYFAGRRSASYFMVGSLTQGQAADIVFGDEGQQWAWMSVQAFLSHPQVVPHLQARLQDYLASQ